MGRPIPWLILLLALVAGPAGAADPEILRKALATDDTAGIQAWIRGQAAETAGDRLAPVARSPSDPALRRQASGLAGDETLIAALAAAYAAHPDPAVKSRLLGLLDQARARQADIAQGIERVRSAPARTVRFTELRLASAGAAGAGGFPADAPIGLTVAYAGAAADLRLAVGWLRVAGGGKDETMAAGELALPKPSGQVGISRAPPKGGWPPGVYRLVLAEGDRPLAEMPFAIAGAGPATAATAAPAPAPRPPAAVPAAAPPAAARPPAPPPPAARPAPARTAPAAAPPQPVQGPAEIVDTGTLRIGGATVRLFGIVGLGGQAAAGLGLFVREQGGAVSCQPRGQAYLCRTGSGVDLAMAALVNGAAKTAPDAPAEYLKQEEDARRNGRGVWAGR